MHTYTQYVYFIIYTTLHTSLHTPHTTHTAHITEPTLLMVLGKRVLDQIYYNNKAKLCEIRIRMMGVDVDLLHAIDHPTGEDSV